MKARNEELLKQLKISKNGITLITLVVTIIILLILASISINLVAGDNGIINRAVWARFSQEMTGLEEKIEISQSYSAIDIISGEQPEEIFTNHVNVLDLPKSLKMEILYVRENMPIEKEPTKEYYIENLLDHFRDETTYVKGLYYVPEFVSGKNESYYIYDAMTKTAYKVKGITLKGKKVHSYKYGCRVMGVKIQDYLDTTQYLIKDESNVVEVNGEKYYAPNLKGFDGLTTCAEYYNDDFSKTQEISISLHMNQQVQNVIEDGENKYTWYDYANKKWANIKTNANKLEAWWVWIPRYAYKIESETQSEIGIIYVDLEGKPLNTERDGVELPEGYIVHPAFTTDKELKGIWVSKYKPSYGKYVMDDLEMSQTGVIPDTSGFDTENTYLIKYSEDGTFVESETKLSKVTDLSKFNNDKKWYNYETKLWANVKTVANGLESWWVWIPRYAYRLPENPNDDTEIIFIDINNKPLDTSKYGDVIPEGFTVHPAFDQDTNSSGNKLSGIWVSKYKPSNVKDTSDDLEMSSVYATPDLSGFDATNTYLIKYSDNGATLEGETQLSTITDINSFNNDKKWYDYKNKLWANVKTVANELESWWVWIPRYAYKLPSNPNEDTEIIFIDINNKPLDTSKYGDTIPEGFTVHPAFDQDTNVNGEKLSGIWICKYKPSNK